MKAKGQRQGITPPEKEEQIKQELAAKDLRTRIQRTEQKIRQYRKKRYPEKSLVQILRKICEEFGAFGEAVAIAQIKRNQWHRLSLDDRMFVEEEKRFLLQSQPQLEEQMEQKNCSAGF